MPIGVGAALLIGSAVAGGTALGAAKIQSNAAGKAQKAQQAGTDRALEVQQRVNQPYLDLGSAAAGRLAAAPFQPYTQQFQAPGGGPPSNGFQPFQPPGGPQGPQGAPPTLGGLGLPQGPPQPRMVTLEAPDGSRREFPMQEADRIMTQARAAGHALRMVR